jgi:DNA-binding MarR family transcriptional regulator
MNNNVVSPETTVQTPPARIDTAMLAWLRLARVYHKIDRRTSETMRQYDISVSRFDVLNHAGATEGRSQQQLADALLVTKGNICQLVDAMEADGLLERRRYSRTKRIYLTDTGRRLRTELLRVQEAAIVADFSALSADETQMLLRLLRKLDHSLDGSTRPAA